jgi:type IV pilus assembly protein PilM
MHKRDDVVAIDLGAQITKAVHLRRKGAGFSLLNYVLVETPVYEKIPTRELLIDHLKSVVRTLGTTPKKAVFVIGTTESLLCHAELPASPASELRKMIKLSPKAHLRQDLLDHLFDCYVSDGHTKSIDTDTGRISRKARVLVGAARRRWVENVQDAARETGLNVEQITLSQVGAVNAFKMLPEDSHADVVALLDIGVANSTIGIVAKGEFLLTRVVNIGAQKISEALAKIGSGDSPGRDEARSGVTDEVQVKLQRSIGLIAKEIHASVNFFETQHDLKVTQVFVSGGSARSQFVLQSLEHELDVPCESWNPTKSLSIDLPAARANEVEYDGPQLAVAIGAGLAYLNPDLITINLLAEEQEAVEVRRRDPVRRATWASAGAIALMLLWAAFLGFKLWSTNAELNGAEAQKQALEKSSTESISRARQARELDRTLTALHQLGASRFLWAPALNALQYTTVPNIQLHHIRFDQTLVTDTPAAAPAAEGEPPRVTERTLLTIRGKNYGDPRSLDKLVEAIAAHPYFKGKLRAVDPVLLKDLQPRQVDPTDPYKTFGQFTIECTFADRILKHE